MMRWSICFSLNTIWSGQDYTAFVCLSICGHNLLCFLLLTGLFLRLGPPVVSPVEWAARCGLWNAKCSSLSLSLWLTCPSMNVKVPNLCLREPVTVVPAAGRQPNIPRRKLSCCMAACRSLMSSMTGNTRALRSVQSPVEEVSTKCFCAVFAFPLPVHALQLTPMDVLLCYSYLESYNHLGWKRPLRSSSPTITSSNPNVFEKAWMKTGEKKHVHDIF